MDAPTTRQVQRAHRIREGRGEHHDEWHTNETVMLDNARELVAGRMRELCDARGVKIISSAPYSPLSNGVAERLVGVATRRFCCCGAYCNHSQLVDMARGLTDSLLAQ